MSGNSEFEDIGGAGFTDCDIRVRAIVLGINRTVLTTISVGDELEVVLANTLEIVTAAGVLGGLNFPGVHRLVRCIHDGHRYIAKVATVSGALCEVDISPK